MLKNVYLVINMNDPNFVFMHNKWYIFIKKLIILFLMLYKLNKKVMHMHHTDFKLHLYISQHALPK